MHIEKNEKSVYTMLKKLSNIWGERSAVNNGKTNNPEVQFDSELEDFSEELLPFKDHHAWIEAPYTKKSLVLSYAWALYNLKTIHIECNIVTPACEDLIKTPPPNTSNGIIIQDVMSEALLDEALHTRMSILGCNYIYEKRSIPVLDFKDFNLVHWNKELISSCTSEGWRRLARFSIACASETLITDYLQVMSEDTSIQRICHEITKTHAIDEWSHSSVFSYAALDIMKDLSEKERAFSKDIINKTIRMFSDNEMDAWKYIFRKIDFPNYKEIIHDSEQFSNTEIFESSVEGLIKRVGL